MITAFIIANFHWIFAGACALFGAFFFRSNQKREKEIAKLNADAEAKAQEHEQIIAEMQAQNAAQVKSAEINKNVDATINGMSDDDVRNSMLAYARDATSTDNKDSHH